MEPVQLKTWDVIRLEIAREILPATIRATAQVASHEEIVEVAFKIADAFVERAKKLKAR